MHLSSPLLLPIINNQLQLLLKTWTRIEPFVFGNLLFKYQAIGHRHNHTDGW